MIIKYPLFLFVLHKEIQFPGFAISIPIHHPIITRNDVNSKIILCRVAVMTHILAYLVFSCTNEEKQSVFSLICYTTNIDIDNIRKCSVQNQVNELILGLHTCKDSVLNEFLEIQDIENGKNEKEEALLSLSELLGVMGKHHVSVVARKVLATLKTALKIKSQTITSINSKVWLSFLSRLDNSTLESVLEEAVILCFPLIKAEPEKFASFFNTVLMKTPNIKPLLQYLPLLPHHESLSPINEAIKKSQNQLERDSKEGLVETLESVRKSLIHESQDVRLFGLMKLKAVLQKNQTIIQQLILDSEKAHESISEIFTFLLGQCRENEDSDLLVAECLGLFGAIDPARLHKDAKKNKLSEIYENIEAESFVTDLVKELARSFLSASDANAQTCASYALQEILRIYKIGPTSSRNAASVGHIVYSKLSSNIQEILKPLQTSKYTISSASQRSPSNFPSPIYRSRYSKTFNHWVINWTCSLIEMVTGNIAKQVYASCKPLVRRDTTTALRILPPLIVCILTEDRPNQIPVATEFLSVIGAEEQIDPHDKFHPSKELQHLAVQTIFSCLDYIERWCRDRKQKETSFRKNKLIFSPSLQLQLVMDFLDQIPTDALALASFKSQAYSRALLHLEAYCSKHPEKLKSNLSFLQSIYVELGEPDGVAGVAAIRQEEPSLKEQIIEYEATGRLHDALGCYERLCIAQETGEIYEGMLKCYLNLGQPQSVLNIAHGLISRK
ncbi:Serine/threonine-protein kinase ATR [Armadillidium nasatum]|uniref:non-specific serine/threonine protein kinase n=1 Tax=Armadillidium nasatum TaxID=96803 RepID=A0A5N5SQF6_9CRUS|nr:Serine/threonine-protein kinase ATR [Armadillidium nasatum]